MDEKNFFDSRDKYLSFVHVTNEKAKIAFYLSEQVWGLSPSAPYHVFDAGTGEGTVISTFLTALHKQMPNVPLIVTGKEISVDDICIVLSYLADRFAEHRPLIFNITNLSYKELADPSSVKFKIMHKALHGNTSYDFTKQLMTMSPFIKKHWALSGENQDGGVRSQNKVFLSIYRADQKVMLRDLLPVSAAQVPRRFDFIIASQPFRLRRPLAAVANGVIAPLLEMLSKDGQMILVYSSGRDFSKALLRFMYPDIKPYENADPKKLLASLKALSPPSMNAVSTRIDDFRYGFINLHTGLKDFSLTNIYSLWNAVTYVGQISESEQKTLEMNWRTVELLEDKFKRIKDKTFVNNVIHFTKGKNRDAS